MDFYGRFWYSMVMARPLRFQDAGLWYHVTNRGNNREDVFAKNPFEEIRGQAMLGSGSFMQRVQRLIRQDHDERGGVSVALGIRSRSCQHSKCCYVRHRSLESAVGLCQSVAKSL